MCVQCLFGCGDFLFAGKGSLMFSTCLCVRLLPGAHKYMLMC